MQVPTETSPLRSLELLLRIVRGAGGAMTLRVFSMAVILVTRVFIARQIGISEFGIFSYALAWMDLLAGVSLLGTDRLIERELSIYHGKQDWTHARGLTQFSFRAVLILTFCILSITLAMVGLSARHYDLRLAAGFLGARDMASPTQHWAYAISLAVVCLPLLSIIRVSGSILRALKHIIRSHLSEFGLRPLLFLGLLGVVFFADIQLTAWHTFLLYGFGLLGTAVYSTYLLRKLTPPDFKTVAVSYETKRWLSAMFTLALLQIAYLANGRAAIIMLGLAANSTAVGIFSAADRVIALMPLALNSFNYALGPHFARFFDQGDWHQLQFITTWGARGAFIAASLLGAVMVIFADQILNVFGGEFVTARPVLMILIMGQLVNAFCGPVTTLLTATYHEVGTSRVVWISAVLNLLANIALIPIYGAIGAALASTITLVYWNIHLAVFARRRLNIDPTILGVFSRRQTMPS